MSHHATHVELRRYREQGYFLRERVLGDANLEPLHEAVEGVHRRISGDVEGGDAGPIEWVDDKRYQKVAGSLVKWEWRDGSAQVRSMEPYHHLDPRLDALTDDPRLWVIPGSHRHGFLPTFQDRGVVGRLYTDLERVPDAQAPLPLEAPAGSVVWFHGDLVHGSQSNRSDSARRVLVLTYQPAGLPRWRHEDVRPVGMDGPTANG